MLPSGQKHRHLFRIITRKAPKHLVDDAPRMGPRHAIARRRGKRLAFDIKMLIVEGAEVIQPSEFDCPGEPVRSLSWL